MRRNAVRILPLQCPDVAVMLSGYYRNGCPDVAEIRTVYRWQQADRFFGGLCFFGIEWLETDCGRSVCGGSGVGAGKRQDERSGICRLAESAVGQADLVEQGEEWLACWICEV